MVQKVVSMTTREEKIQRIKGIVITCSHLRKSREEAEQTEVVVAMAAVKSRWIDNQ